MPLVQPILAAVTVIALLAIGAWGLLQVGLHMRLRHRGPARRVAVPLLLLGLLLPSVAWAARAPLPLRWRSSAVVLGEEEISSGSAFGAKAVGGVFRHAQTAATDPRKWDGPGFGRDTARFLQVDPSGYADSPNLYAGFANDPVNHRDPTGMETDGGYSAGWAAAYVYDDRERELNLDVCSSSKILEFDTWCTGLAAGSRFRSRSANAPDVVGAAKGGNWQKVLYGVLFIGGLVSPDSPEMQERARKDAQRDMADDPDLGQTPGARILQNNEQGASFEDRVGRKLAETKELIVPQVRVETQGGGQTILDFVTREKGRYECVECKSSETAPFTRRQRENFPEIEKTGAVVVSRDKPGLPAGTKLPPRKVKIIRKKR